MREFIICIITAFISSFLFVQIISFPFGFTEFFVAVYLWAVFVLPFFLVGGFISLFVVSFVPKKSTLKNYFISLFIFIFFGMICNVLALWHFRRSGLSETTLSYLYLGIFGSVLYFHIWLLLNKLTKSKKLFSKLLSERGKFGGHFK